MKLVIELGLPRAQKIFEIQKKNYKIEKKIEIEKKFWNRKKNFENFCSFFSLTPMSHSHFGARGNPRLEYHVQS